MDLDEVMGCLFGALIIGGVGVLILALCGVFSGPVNHDPKKGEVHTSDSLWEWCKGPDMFYQPDAGFSRPVTIRVNSPECK